MYGMCIQARRLNGQAIKPTQKSKSVTNNVNIAGKIINAWGKPGHGGNNERPTPRSTYDNL
jgi:hypothetical protein